MSMAGFFSSCGWLGTGRSYSLILNRPDAACPNYRIDGLRNGGTIGIGHHVPSILNEVQDGTAQRPV
jgi:hypothetical protein